MTRIGIVMQKYGELVEPRPYSLFTSDPDEGEANHAWQARAMEWGATRVDQWGNYLGEAS
jgi:hypothetical protein